MDAPAWKALAILAKCKEAAIVDAMAKEIQWLTDEQVRDWGFRALGLGAMATVSNWRQPPGGRRELGLGTVSTALPWGRLARLVPAWFGRLVRTDGEEGFDGGRERSVRHQPQLRELLQL